jgi:hypothetical protein
MGEQEMTIKIVLKEPSVEDDIFYEKMVGRFGDKEYRSVLDSILYIWYDNGGGKTGSMTRAIVKLPTQTDEENLNLKRFLIQNAVSECIKILVSEKEK